jgi:hypothetical protein
VNVPSCNSLSYLCNCYLYIILNFTEINTTNSYVLFLLFTEINTTISYVLFLLFTDINTTISYILFLLLHKPNPYFDNTTMILIKKSILDMYSMYLSGVGRNECIVVIRWKSLR